MKSKKLSLGDYLVAALPDDLWWYSRPPHGPLEDAWRERRRQWCELHHVDPLQLIRHDVAAKLAEPDPQPHLKD